MRSRTFDLWLLNIYKKKKKRNIYLNQPICIMYLYLCIVHICYMLLHLKDSWLLESAPFAAATCMANWCVFGVFEMGRTGTRVRAGIYSRCWAIALCGGTTVRRQRV